VETQTKLQLEGVALSTVRKQMAEAMEEGRKKDEKVGRLACGSRERRQIN
jgi:hypothetical protein